MVIRKQKIKIEEWYQILAIFSMVVICITVIAMCYLITPADYYGPLRPSASDEYAEKLLNLYDRR